MKKRTKKELSAAALKAWATRRAARRQNGRSKRTKVQPQAPTRLRADATAEAYITRITSAIEHSTKGDGLREAGFVGQDMGGGWIILTTDGWRALTQKGQPDITYQKTVRPVMLADPAPHGLTLTPELETALRTLRRTLDKKVPDVTIEIDGRRKRAVLRTSTHMNAVPVAGDLAAAHLRVNLRFLLDGLGRGGRLGYNAKQPESPLTIDTTDGLRYILMPVRKLNGEK